MKTMKTTAEDGLERLVADNIGAIADGIAYIAVGKPASGNGFRFWRMEILYHEEASERGFGNVRRLIGEDPKAILFNAYESAWAGIAEDGSYKSIADVARRIRNAYKLGLRRAAVEDVDALMPPEMRAECEAEMARRIACEAEMERTYKICGNCKECSYDYCYKYKSYIRGITASRSCENWEHEEPPKGAA
jgi:hypothetical protein